MTVDVDTSVLVSLFVRDRNVAAADRIAARRRRWSYSIWTQAEFASSIGILLRNGDLKPPRAERVEQAFADWCERVGDAVQVGPADIIAARRLVLDRSLKLRVPDALHLAVALRRRSGLATLDGGLASAAEALGLEVLNG